MEIIYCSSCIECQTLNDDTYYFKFHKQAIDFLDYACRFYEEKNLYRGGNNMEVIINFGGFYETLHGTALDNIIENPFQDDNGEIPADFYEAAVIDYEAAKKDYCKAFIDFINETLKIKLKFKELISPKEYNFSTDRIAAEITETDYKKVVKFVKKEYADDLEAEILDATTAKSGYIPFYTAEELKADKSLFCQMCFDVLLRWDLDANEWNDYFDVNYLYELGFRNGYVKYENF